MNPGQLCYACGAYPGDPCPKDDDVCPYPGATGPPYRAPRPDPRPDFDPGAERYRAEQVRGRDDV